MAELLALPLARMTDANGRVYPGGKLYAYVTGTTTPISTYTTSALNIAHPNPIVADAGGLLPPIFLDHTATYRFVGKTSAGAPISGYDFDPVSLANADDIGFLQSGTGAVATSVKDKLRETVSVLDFGAVGDGTTNDTAACALALATGKNVLFPESYTFAVTNLTGWANNRRYYGGGCLKKYGSTSTEPICLLPDESDGVWFDGLEFDGNWSIFAFGNPVSAILGHLAKSVKVTGCYFHDIIDGAIKLRDSANLYAAGNRIVNCKQNGIELRHYINDPRFGGSDSVTPYSAARPVLQGGHRIIGNRFERVTRLEDVTTGIVDGCGVTFDGAAGYPFRDMVIEGNTFIDCLRSVWSENNTAGSEADGVVVNNNTLRGSVNGGTAQLIYGKVGIGLVSVRNAVISNNTISNIANYAPIGTETAGIFVSGSPPTSSSDNISVFGNSVVDSSGAGGRTQYGIRIYAGTNVRVFHNYTTGASIAQVSANASNVTEFESYANRGATDDLSWGQPTRFTFALQNIPASATTDMLVGGETGIDAAILPCGGRVVGQTARLSAAGTGNFDFKVYLAAVEQAGVRIIQTTFAAGLSARAIIAAGSAAQAAAGNQITVKVTTDGTWVNTVDASVDVWVDLGFKL